MTLARLSHAINSARQLAQHARGVELDAERADRIAAHLRAAQNLVRGRDVQPVERFKPEQSPVIQTGTRRFKLWQRSPLCLWCGCVTRIEGVHQDDAATLDHLYPRGRRDGHALPSTVLACRRCNASRGRPPEPKGETCPAIEGMRRAA
jgi:5-methylcytosine-specific restriction endonuclease McrA